jgi:polyphosphate glucokinase
MRHRATWASAVRIDMKVLVIDVGGTSIKILGTGHPTAIKLSSGPRLTPKRLIECVLEAIDGWEYSAVSVGYPGPVKDNKPAADPRNLGRGWVGFDFGKAFNRPVKVVNDAAMQALGSYGHGRMLFMGLGTGLGTTLIFDGIVAPMELAHLPYKNGRTYEEYLGKAGLRRGGKKRWRKNVEDVIRRFKAALEVDDVVIGGGNAKLLKRLPPGVRRVNNAHAFVGGFRLWKQRA